MNRLYATIGRKEALKPVRVYFADFLDLLEKPLQCVRCGRLTCADIIVCNICARRTVGA